MSDFNPFVTRIGGTGKTWPWEVAALALATALVADYLVFRLLDLNYFRWYLAAGPVIQLLVTFVAVAVDLEREPRLVSTHPGEFAASCLAVGGESLVSFSAMLTGVPRSGGDLPRTGPLDWVFAALFAFAFMGLFVAWLIVVAPLQYFGNLVAGAPARRALAAPTRFVVERMREQKMTTLTETPADTIPEGAEQIGLTRRPVALTASITAALLFAISYFA